jgi:hypothetical protein
MRRTPAPGGAGWSAAKQDSVALRPERRGRSRASDSPSSGECRVSRTPANATIGRGGGPIAKQDCVATRTNSPTNREYMAMEAYVEAISPSTSAERKTEIERDLKAYSALDTEAMIRIWAEFRSL